MNAGDNYNRLLATVHFMDEKWGDYKIRLYAGTTVPLMGVEITLLERVKMRDCSQSAGKAWAS